MAALPFALALPSAAAAQQVAYAATAVSELDSATRTAVVRELGRAQARGLPATVVMPRDAPHECAHLPRDGAWGGHRLLRQLARLVLDAGRPDARGSE